MKAKISKEYKWSMSHRLPFYDGICSNIHGHSYKIRVIATGEVDENGILIDFYDLDKAVMPIIKKLDHSFICDEKDTKVIEFLKENNFKHVVFPVTTTAENVGNQIMIDIAQSLKKYPNVKFLTVRFYETDDAYAELEMEI